MNRLSAFKASVGNEIRDIGPYLVVANCILLAAVTGSSLGTTHWFLLLPIFISLSAVGWAKDQAAAKAGYEATIEFLVLLMRGESIEIAVTHRNEGAKPSSHVPSVDTAANGAAESSGEAPHG